MLFGVPLSLLGYNYGMSSPGGKISFAYTQVKHFFNYTLLIRLRLKYVYDSKRTDSSHRCCYRHSRKISSRGNNQWYSSKCFSTGFEEWHSESATLFWSQLRRRRNPVKFLPNLKRRLQLLFPCRNTGFGAKVNCFIPDFQTKYFINRWIFLSHCT